ncbi:hypothetical protein [Bosea sp. UNC402CLCol]|uniref:hypothetical protein n=1 Tax=Bosea sp. UNC402CLCol TaxID=1510531 RepID=UPI0018CDE8EB|nr:hypothetical protein [Bosea sp. UNC402CLCol]
MNRPIPNAGADSAVAPVFELRRQTLKPGQRETLIVIFDAVTRGGHVAADWTGAGAAAISPRQTRTHLRARECMD